jgi:hypothetical protein
MLPESMKLRSCGRVIGAGEYAYRLPSGNELGLVVSAVGTGGRAVSVYDVWFSSVGSGQR